MDREKGEYLARDEDKRRELDQQSQEYVSDTPALPSMNADPSANPDPAGARDATDTPDPTDSADPTDAANQVES